MHAQVLTAWDGAALYDIGDAADADGFIPTANITDALWIAANEQLLENRKKFYRPTKHEYLLRGRVRCGECGSNMAGSWRLLSLSSAQQRAQTRSGLFVSQWDGVARSR